MVRTIQGSVFKDPAAETPPLFSLWLQRYWRTIFFSVLLLPLGLGLLWAAIELHVWDLKDLKLFMTLPLGLGILYWYPRLIMKCIGNPLRTLAKTPEARRFLRGEIVAVESTFNDFGWGYHFKARLRFQDAQGQAHEFSEHFSMAAWYSFVGGEALKEPIPVWIVCATQEPSAAAFVGLEQAWLEAKLANAPAAKKLKFWRAVLAVFVMGALTVGILIFMYQMGWME